MQEVNIKSLHYDRNDRTLAISGWIQGEDGAIYQFDNLLSLDDRTNLVYQLGEVYTKVMLDKIEYFKSPITGNRVYGETIIQYELKGTY